MEQRNEECAVLGALAESVVEVPGSTPCPEVEALFGARSDLCTVVVLDSGATSWGVLARSEFSDTMTGRHGYGRALHAKRPVSDLADWEPLLLPPSTSVEVAAQAALARDDRRRYQDVLTWTDEGAPALVPAAKVFNRLAAEYGHRALHEPLTGLANRDLFLSRLEQQCRALTDGGRGHVGVVYVDLDRFKSVNDTLGHDAGDHLLREVARRLLAAVRPDDLVARLGGDEFAVLLHLPEEADGGRASRDLRQLGQRLLDHLARPVAYGQTVVVPAASIGMSRSTPGVAHADTLLREADLAMYEAKRRGGQQVHVVEDVGAACAVPTVMLVDDSLTVGLRAGEFRVHYQPLVRLDEAVVVGAEALVRWQHPERGLLGPDQFLPAAEANGAIVDIGGWVLLTACEQLASWDREGRPGAPAAMNVNVSVRQLLSGRLLEQVQRALAASGLPAHRLRLELPETATMEQLQAARPLLAQLRHLGVLLLLDDVGAGANSLRHLTSLEVDGMKIDRSFIRTMLTDRRDMAVVRMLIELADALGVSVTAEGVETEAQRAALVDLGCRYAQGYLFGRPQAAAASRAEGVLSGAAV